MSSRLNLVIFCAIVAISNAFKPGTERTFSLINDVSQTDIKTPNKAFSYRISGSVKVGTIWSSLSDNNDHLLKFELESPQLYLQKLKADHVDFDAKSSVLKSYQKTTFYAHWHQGEIKKAFLPRTKDSSIDNFLKSILSLFQYQLSDSEWEQENDISGTCSVKYVAKTSTTVMKYKTDCTCDLEPKARIDKPFDVGSRMTRVNVLKTSADGQLESIHSTDHHKFTGNTYEELGVTVTSLLYLAAESTQKEIKVYEEKTLAEVVKKLKDVDETDLLPVLIDERKIEEKPLIKAFKDVKDHLASEHVGTVLSASTFLQLLPIVRSAKLEDLTRILNARTTRPIRGQFIDVLAAAQTRATHEAFLSSLNATDEENYDDIERYYQGLAVGTKPEESVIRDLLAHLLTLDTEDDKLRSTLIQSMSGMTRKFAHIPEQDYESKVVSEVRNFLLKNINACETNECKVMYIRGLQNLRSPDTVEKLLKLALNFPYKVSVAAMKALSAFQSSDFDFEMKKSFEDIFYQRLKKFDSSARTLALDILLKFKLNQEDVKRLLNFLKSNDRAFEIKQYVMQRLKLSAEECPLFNKMLMTALTKDPEVNNYNVFGGLKGLSTTLKQVYAKQPSFNGSIVSVQEMKSGSLKRGIVDLRLHAGDESTSLFSLGMFTGGLGSFMKSTDEEVDPDEDTTVTAGMELAIQGAQMRPLVFFTGQGELMSKVWSGAGKEPTTAYKGTTLLMDLKKAVPLNNGAMMEMTMVGAFSIDLNGKVEISLWYSTADSEIVQRTGTAIKTITSIKSSVIELLTISEVVEEPQLNLETTINFANKPILCLQLSQTSRQLNQTIVQSINIPGQMKPEARRREIKLRYNIPGTTHVLNKRNTQMCNEILKET